MRCAILKCEFFYFFFGLSFLFGSIIMKPRNHVDLICRICLNLICSSSNIQMVVDKEYKDGTSAHDSALCTACEMAVVWIQNQLQQDGVKEKVLEYVNQVIFIIFCYSRRIGS